GGRFRSPALRSPGEARGGRRAWGGRRRTCRSAAGPVRGAAGEGPLDGLGDPPQQVDELSLREVERLDLDVRDDPALERLELHPLRIGYRHPGLLLSTERLELPVEIGEQSPGLGVFRDGALRLLVPGDRGVLADELAELLGLLHDLIGVDGHRVSSGGGPVRAVTIMPPAAAATDEPPGTAPP